MKAVSVTFMRVCECGAGMTCISFSMVLQCQVCGFEIEVIGLFRYVCDMMNENECEVVDI